MLTVDQAHYAKNPDTARHQAVMEMTARTSRVLFLTSKSHLTERRLDLCPLFALLRPGLADGLPLVAEAVLPGALDAAALQRAAAPAYLRRTAADLADAPGHPDTDS